MEERWIVESEGLTHWEALDFSLCCALMTRLKRLSPFHYQAQDFSSFLFILRNLMLYFVHPFVDKGNVWSRNSLCGVSSEQNSLRGTGRRIRETFEIWIARPVWTLGTRSLRWHVNSPMPLVNSPTYRSLRWHPRSLRRHPDGVGELANGERELTNSVGELVVGELICRRRDR